MCELIQVYILAGRRQCTKISLPGMKVLAMSFFDDVELALLLELEGGVRVLCTLTYSGRNYENIEPINELSTLALVWYGTVSYTTVLCGKCELIASPLILSWMHHLNFITSRLYPKARVMG